MRSFSEWGILVILAEINRWETIIAQKNGVFWDVTQYGSCKNRQESVN
jgi:hypothetical protein